MPHQLYTLMLFISLLNIRDSWLPITETKNHIDEYPQNSYICEGNELSIKDRRPFSNCSTIFSKLKIRVKKIAVSAPELRYRPFTSSKHCHSAQSGYCNEFEEERVHDIHLPIFYFIFYYALYFVFQLTISIRLISFLSSLELERDTNQSKKKSQNSKKIDLCSFRIQ